MKNSKLGTVFLIPESGSYIVAQVGNGADLGVFDLTSENLQPKDIHDARLLFRVDYWRGSPARNGWIDAGVLALHPKLREFARYGHHSVGESHYYAVSHEPTEEEISQDEYDSLEPLATWTHEHIVSRFSRQTSAD